MHNTFGVGFSGEWPRKPDDSASAEWIRAKLAAINEYLACDITLGEQHCPFPDEERLFRVHTIIGTTLTCIAYRSPDEDNIEGYVVIEHWFDRNVIKSRKRPTRPPDGLAVFSISNNDLSKNERHAILDMVRRTMAMGRGSEINEEIPHVGHDGVKIIKGGGALSGQPGLMDLDPEPLVLINSHGDDPLFEVVRDAVAESLPSSHVPCGITIRDCWMTYRHEGVSQRIPEALAVYHGARNFVLQKKLSASFGIQFEYLQLLRDEEGVYLSLHAPLQSVNRDDSYANGLVDNLRVATMMGCDLARPRDDIEIYGPNIYGMVKAFVLDHQVAAGNDALFATSLAVETLLKITSPEYLKEMHRLADSHSQIKIVNAILHGVRWPHLMLVGNPLPTGQAALLVNCDISDSVIHCCARNAAFANCYVKNSEIGFFRLADKLDDDKLYPAREVDFLGGRWERTTKLQGGIESGRMVCRHFKADTSDMRLWNLR